ncbi:hypothetical protein [Vibrio sp. AND4]|nr:hypothetical protein [Vibrio sp. AND4]
MDSKIENQPYGEIMLQKAIVLNHILQLHYESCIAILSLLH